MSSFLLSSIFRSQILLLPPESIHFENVNGETENKKVRKAPLPKRLDFGCALHTKVRLTKENTAGILTYERRQMPDIFPLKMGAARSNTVMAVAPDSNRISFSSTQLTTFQTVFSCRILSFFGFSIAQIFVLVNYAPENFPWVSVGLSMMCYKKGLKNFAGG